MALFPQSFLDDLKAQTDIVSVIGEVTPLKKAGATWKGLCPFHQEKTPSFNVNRDKGFFKCFGCGAGGDVVKFVELHQKMPFPEAVRLPRAARGHDDARDGGRTGGPGGAQPSARRSSQLHEQAAGVLPGAAGHAGRRPRPAGARDARPVGRDDCRRSAMATRRRAGATPCTARLRRPKVPRAAPTAERARPRARRRPAGRPVPEPADDPHRPRHGGGRGLRRPGARRGAGTRNT